MKILIDNGHGADTWGKRSPDGKLLEYAWNREIAARVIAGLTARGYQAQLLVPETHDIPLNERVRRANAICRKERCILVSIHVNAAGSDARWKTARGWSVFVAPNASADSKLLAESLFEQARARGLKTRQQYPNIGYWMQSLAMCRDTICPAVLTENMFMDNPDDCRWLLSEAGKQAIVDIHIDGIINYLR